MNATPRIDLLLATLNATEMGSLESIATKMREVGAELQELGETELAGRAEDAVCALARGDTAGFQRGRAFLQSKIGHLR
jgi:hypothetical protein